jgi:CCR4-NOT transcription complex subunit 1
LSSALLEAGYDCCASVASVESLFQRAGEIKEPDVAQALGLMARTHTNLNGVGDGSPGDTWNVRNFATAVKINVSPTTFIICMVYSLHTRLNPLFDQYPSINWKSVIQSLDYEHFLLYDSTGLEMLVQAWREWTEVRIMMFVFFPIKASECS